MKKLVLGMVSALAITAFSLGASPASAQMASKGATTSKGVVAAARSPTLERIKARGKLVVGNGMRLHGYNYVNAKTGRNEGFMAEMAEAVAKRLLGDPSKVEYIKVTSANRIQHVVDNKIDLLIDAVYRNPSNADFVEFSDMFYPAGAGLLVRKGSKIRGPADLKEGVRVVHEPDTPEYATLKAMAPKATYIGVDGDKESWDAFRNGAEVYAWSVPGLYDAVAQNPGYVVVNQFTLKPYGIIYDKNDPELGRVLNTIIAEMRAAGEIDRLYTKWFGVFGGPSSR